MKKTLIILSLSLSVVFAAYSQSEVWSLEKCIQYAIDNNITIKQQELQTQYQSNTLKQSKLGRLPSLNATASNNFSFGRALDETTYQFTENESVMSSNFSAGASLTLFNGLQNMNTIKSNQYNLEASLKDLDKIRDDISLSVALGYLQILLNKELVSVTMNQLQTSKEQIEKTSKMVDAGSLARGTLLEIQAQAAMEELQLINMENQLTISYLNLSQLMELESDEGFEIVVPEINIGEAGIIDGDVYGIFDDAEKIRPELESARLSLKSAEYGLLVAKGGRSPRLTFSTSLRSGYSDIRQHPVNDEYPFASQLTDNINYGLGLSLNIPIFNGWQVNTNISNSRINIQNSMYVLEGTRKQLYKNIQQAFADAEASLKSYYASQKAVESMEESFRYTEQKLNVGMVTPVEYNAAKTQLLSAQSDLAQSKYEYVFKTKVLDFYRGNLLSLDY